MDTNDDAQFRTVRGYQRLNQQSGGLSPALEDYLEMVYRLCIRDNYARVGKISELLHVKPSSASKMIFKLAELQYLKYDRYEIILLTERGRELGAFLLYRHNTVDRVLQLVGVADSLEETELIEHSLNPKTVARLNLLLEFFQKDDALLKRFQQFQREFSK